MNTYLPAKLESLVLRDIRRECENDYLNNSILDMSNLTMESKVKLKELFPKKSTYRHVLKCKNKFLNITKKIIRGLDLDEPFQEIVSKTFDFMFPLLPKGTKLRNLHCLAEIIIFHVLKANNDFTNWDLFVTSSPLGHMPMSHRTWLLRYKQYITSGKGQGLGSVPLGVYLERLYESPRITREIKARCEVNKEILIRNFKCIRPITIAGIACYFTFKNLPENPISIKEALARMGIEHAGTINNAVTRLKKRREYREDLFSRL